VAACQRIRTPGDASLFRFQKKAKISPHKNRKTSTKRTEQRAKHDQSGIEQPFPLVFEHPRAGHKVCRFKLQLSLKSSTLGLVQLVACGDLEEGTFMAQILRYRSVQEPPDRLSVPCGGLSPLPPPDIAVEGDAKNSCESFSMICRWERNMVKAHPDELRTRIVEAVFRETAL